MKVSKWREHLNKRIYPHLEEMIGKGKVLDIGKSGFWDYRIYFPNSEYIISDRDTRLKPDVIDNIACSKFKDGEFDMVIFNGVFEQVEGNIKTDDLYISKREGVMIRVFNEMRRILKKDGILVCGLPGNGFPRYGKDRDVGRRISDFHNGLEWVYYFCHILETKAFYNKGRLQYLYIIGQKK